MFKLCDFAEKIPQNLYTFNAKNRERPIWLLEFNFGR